MSLKLKNKFTVRDIVLFSLLGALLVAGDIAFELLPNIHPVSALTMIYTLVWRQKALISVVLYALITCIYSGFQWGLPYIYIFPLLWGITMLLPRKMPIWLQTVVYPAVCGLHGLLFGALYAPAWAIMGGLTLQETLAWILAGLPADLLQCAGNALMGTLILPISLALKRIEGNFLRK